MIITRLSGGLGNQMFQYAMGRALSLRTGTALRIDTSFYETALLHEAPRNFALSHFNIAAVAATTAEYRDLGVPELRDRSITARVRRRLRRYYERLLPPSRRRLVVEREYAFMPDAFAAGHDCVLSGVWQSHRYFDGAEETLRRDFTLAAPLSEQAAVFEKEMKASPSASLHVRRGDYASNDKTSMKHGTCSPAYYAAAIAYLREREPNVRFFVFSDDIAWVKANIPISGNPIFVSSFGFPDYEELILMSRAKHHILANSSFSWWGAWMNQDSTKIVLAPRAWFADATIDTTDLLPDTWTRL